MNKPTKCSKVDALPKGTRVLVHGERVATVHFWRFNRKLAAWECCVAFDSITENNAHTFANIAPADVKRAPKSAGPCPGYVPPNGASMSGGPVVYC